MKLIATGDWHIGLSFHGYDRSHEHKHFFEWLLGQLAEHQPSALLVAGDVFDNANPSASAQSIFYDFLVEAHKAAPHTRLIITAGNHDSAARLQAPAPLMKWHNIEVRGIINRLPSQDGKRGEPDIDSLLIPITDSGGEEAVVAAVPFIRPDSVSTSYSEGVRELLESIVKRARELFPQRPLVLMAHMYASGAEIADRDHSERIYVGGQEAVSLTEMTVTPDYFTCGHIHKRQRIRRMDNARYTGSVLPMSFAEKDYKHSVDLIDLANDGTSSVTHLEYEPLHGLKVLSNAGLTKSKFKKLIAEELPSRDRSGELSGNYIYAALEIDAENTTTEERRVYENLVTERDAVLCAVRAVKTAVMPGSSTERRAVTLDEILDRPVMETLRDAYMSRHNEEPDDQTLALLKEIADSVQLKSLSDDESD